MNGAEIAALYAFPPNSLGYCGPESFCGSLSSHIRGRDGLERLEAELRNFRVHHAYLSLIARESGLRPFDREVVEAFWIGNPLLENVSRSALRRFVKEDLFAGKSAARAKKLSDALPDGILPHHSFNALYVNFVTDAVKRDIRSYDSCCVTWGEVLGVSGNRARLRRTAVIRRNGFALEERDGTVLLGRNGISPIRASDIRAGDLLSVHWGLAVQKLSPEDVRALEKYTGRNIDAINGCMMR